MIKAQNSTSTLMTTTGIGVDIATTFRFKKEIDKARDHRTGIGLPGYRNSPRVNSLQPPLLNEIAQPFTSLKQIIWIQASLHAPMTSIWIIQ